LTITANAVTNNYGAGLSTPVSGSTNFTSSGLVNSNTISSVTISYTAGTSSNSAVGVYTNAVVPSAAVGITTSNYSITYASNNLTISAVAPGVPTITGITAGNLQLSVAISAPSSDGGASVTNYQYSTNGSSGTFTAFSPAQTNSPLTISNLVASTQYSISLKAVNSAGAGSASTATNGTPYTTPAAPTSLAVTNGNGQVGISFTAGTNNGSAITNYQYSIDGGTSFTAFSPAQNASPVTITGLSNGTTYSLALKAVNAAGAGTASTNVSGAPAAPASPTISVVPATLASALTTTYGTSSTEASFSVSGSTLTGNLTVTAPTGYEVCTTSGGTFTDSVSLTASSGSVASTTIYARIKATAGVSGTYNGVNFTVTGGGATQATVATAASGNAVSAKGLTITGISIADKVYNRDTTATISGTAAYSGLVNSDSFSISGTPSASFGDNTVGNAKSVSVAGYTAPSSNYSIAQPTGLTANITAKALTIPDAAVTAKNYDNTTAATITGTLSGVISGDTVTLNGTGTFASADVGSGISVTSTSTLGGASSGNYSLTQPTGLTGNINQATQTITFTNNLTGLTVGSTNAMTATASSGLTVSYTVANTNIATVSGTNLIAVAPGSTTVVASQSGNANYSAATPVTNNVSVVAGPTTLAAGDIAFLQYDADNPDKFTFVTLVDLNGGTVINFTDNGFASATTGTTAEGFLTFTVPAGTTYSAGTTFTWTSGMTVTGTPWSSGAPTNFAFNASGDQLFAFQGSTANWATQSGITLVAGLIQRTTWLTSGTAAAATSYQPSGLDSAYIVSLATENGYYANGTSTASSVSASGTRSQLWALFGDGTNKWYNNATGPLTAPTYTVALTQSQTITFTAIPAKTYGDSSFALSATANSGLSVSYSSSDTSVATVAGSTVTILKAGSANIVASQAGGTANGVTYAAATPVTNNLSVGRKAATVTAEAKSKTYGSANPALTYVASGLMGADTLSGSLATSATANSSVSGSPYTITQGTVNNANNPNYDISYTSANLTVNTKSLTVTANNVSKVQGVTLSGGAGSTAFTSSGLVTGDAIDSVTISYTSGADSSATAGSYVGAVVPSVATGTSFAASNYSISYVAGDLTVTANPAISVIGSLSSRSATYGTASTAASFSVSGGFLSGDLSVRAPSGFEISTSSGSGYGSSLNLGATSGTVSSTTIYVRLAATTAAGTYSGNVTVSGGGATTQNVAIGSSTVAPKALTITGLSGVNKVYDRTTTASTTGTASFSGLVNDESFSVTGTPTATFANANVGTSKVVTITGYSSPSANYSLTDPTVSADITAVSLTIPDAAVTAKNYDGTTAATITGTLTGVISGDTVTFTGTGTFATAAPGTGIVVTAACTLGGAQAGNYSLTQPTGLSGTINKTSQTITFGALANKNVGDAAFNLTATATSGLSVSFSSSDSSVASIAGNTVTVLKAGKVTITATQAGNDNYAAATPVQQSFFILGSGSILFTGINTTNPDQFSFVAMHDLPGSLAITFTDNAWSGSALGTSEGNLVYTTAAGGLAAGSRVVIERSASGNTATIVSGSGSVGTPGASFSLNGSGDNVFAYTGTSSSPNFLAGILTSVALTTGSTSSSLTYVPTAISGATVQLVSSGTIANSQYTGTTTGVPSLLASALVDRSNWGNSSSVLTLSTTSFTFIGAQQSQTITFGSLDAKTYGDSTFALSATADSGLTVSYSSSDTSVAPVAGSTVTILKAGVTTFTASQAGNAQYAAATSVQQTLTVGAKSLTGSFTAANKNYDGTTAATVTGRSLTGVLGSDVVSLTGGTATFDTASAGSNKTVTLAGASLSGAAAANYSLGSVSTTTANITAVSLGSGDITITPVGDGSFTASATGVSGFSYSYSGRTASGVATSYGPSSSVPTAPGFYTVTATSTDGNYSGSGSSNYFISGPVAANDAVTKPADNQPFVIEATQVLANDVRITSGGAVSTSGLTVTGVTSGSGNTAELDGDVLFTPSSNSTDTFTYTVSDGSKTATATVTVTTESSAPTFTLAIVKLGTATYSAPNTTVTHDFIGVPNQTYLVEYTTNLNGTWTSAGNQSTGATGSFSVTLTTAGNVASSWNTAMFFRAKVVANP
jgi:endonuclease YncB( thermonuclease family)